MATEGSALIPVLYQQYYNLRLAITHTIPFHTLPRRVRPPLAFIPTTAAAVSATNYRSVILTPSRLSLQLL